MIPRISPPIGQPLITAVTGTNGKTSVATATLQLMRGVGWRSAGYNSTGINDVDGVMHEAKVRRSAAYLPELIDTQVRHGATAISLEAFVGILADGLFEHVEVDVAVSTGLERDHLDVHGSIEGYWAAKLRLFEEYLRPDGIAVLATGSPQGERVAQAARRRGARVMTVGDGGDVWLDGARESHGQLTGRLVVGDESCDVVLPTVHDVAVTNLLLAATAVLALGAQLEAVADALGRVTPPPGRLEIIAQRDGATAMVDTAHNPSALRTALRAVRGRTRGRIVLVFGAGGERDRTKRREMGRIAAQFADLVILTDDNPRREPPQRIRDEVRAGTSHCIEVPRRAEAIRAALEMARAGDVVLVAGKGDERYQLVGTRRIPHDDREVIRQAWDSEV